MRRCHALGRRQVVQQLGRMVDPDVFAVSSHRLLITYRLAWRDTMGNLSVMQRAFLDYLLAKKPTAYHPAKFHLCETLGVLFRGCVVLATFALALSPITIA